MHNQTATGSYSQRQACGYNKAEDLFEKELENKKLSYSRFGFDEKNGFIPNFWQINPIIRSLPDYTVFLNGKNYYFHIKGTNKIKMYDLMNYFTFQSLFCTERTPLYLGIFHQNSIFYSKLENIIKITDGLTVKHFENDSKLYFDLPILKLTEINEDIIQ